MKAHRTLAEVDGVERTIDRSHGWGEERRNDGLGCVIREKQIRTQTIATPGHALVLCALTSDLVTMLSIPRRVGRVMAGTMSA